MPADPMSVVPTLDHPTPPAHYSRRKGRVYQAGWTDASNGVSVSTPPAGPEWRREAWRAGHDAFHEWLQQNRVRACDRVEVPTHA